MKTSLKDRVRRLNYYYSHKEKESSYMKKYRELNKDKISLKKKEYYFNNRDKIIKKVKEYVNSPIGKLNRNNIWKKYVINNPVKQRARNLVSNAIKYGKLISKPCKKCKNPKSQAHHTNYSKPFKITWLCHKHHRQMHGQLVGIK